MQPKASFLWPPSLRASLAVPGRLLERICHLQHAPIATMATDDLEPNGQSVGGEPARH